MSVAELLPSDVIVAEPRDLVQSLPITGTIKAVNFAAIKARVAGEVKEFSVREGDAVTAGQVIANVGDQKLSLQQGALDAQIAAARAEQDQAQSELDRAEALSHFILSMQQAPGLGSDDERRMLAAIVPLPEPAGP